MSKVRRVWFDVEGDQAFLNLGPVLTEDADQPEDFKPITVPVHRDSLLDLMDQLTDMLEGRDGLKKPKLSKYRSIDDGSQ